MFSFKIVREKMSSILDMYIEIANIEGPVKNVPLELKITNGS